MHSRFCSSSLAASARSSRCCLRSFTDTSSKSPPHANTHSTTTKSSFHRSSRVNLHSKSSIATWKTGTRLVEKLSARYASSSLNNPSLKHTNNNRHRFEMAGDNVTSDGSGICVPQCTHRSPLSIYTDAGISADLTSNDNTSEQTVWKHHLIPHYLSHTYWWAYIHPNAVKFFERQWLVNAILWGNFNDLRNAAIEDIDDTTLDKLVSTADSSSPSFLQIAAVYGSFTSTLLEKKLLPLSQRLTPSQSPTLHLIDIAPVQLLNTHQKLLSMDIAQSSDVKQHCNVILSHQSSSSLSYDTNTMDVVYLFFLLHEMPLDVRIPTLNEAIRVMKPDSGKLVVVDYHQPQSKWNPMRYVMRPVLTYLEPFAMDLWRTPVTDWIDFESDDDTTIKVEKKLYFGGLYQKCIITKVSKS